MAETPRYEQLTDALSRLGFSQDAAEFHGAVCGALCVKSPSELDPMRLMEKEKATDGSAEAEETLRSVCGQSAQALESSEMNFGPMLPEDTEKLTDRVRALSSWCEGFLFGLSTGKPLNLKICSPELKEIVRDFTEFTRAGIDDGEDAELEESAYAELVEYIRVGAQLVYMELRAPSAHTVH